MSDKELQLRLLYAVIVAGKSAKFAEQAMVRLFSGLGDDLPFTKLRTWISDGSLNTRLREARTGNYDKVSKAFSDIAKAEMDLHIVDPMELEKIHGIGPKTARFFIIWTRPNARVAALDVHILRWLRGLGYNAPRQTPQGKKYTELEQVFLVEADKRGVSPRVLDAQVWSTGSRYDQNASFNLVSDMVGHVSRNQGSNQKNS